MAQIIKTTQCLNDIEVELDNGATFSITFHNNRVYITASGIRSGLSPSSLPIFCESEDKQLNLSNYVNIHYKVK